MAIHRANHKHFQKPPNFISIFRHNPFAVQKNLFIFAPDKKSKNILVLKDCITKLAAFKNLLSRIFFSRFLPYAAY